MASQETDIWSGSPSQITNFKAYAVCALIALTGVGIFVGVPYAFWRYLVVKNQRVEITTQRIRFHKGVLSKHIDELELYRVKDTRFDQSFFLRIFGLGNIIVISSDSTDPTVKINAIKDAKNIREKLRNLVEDQRNQKRVRFSEFD